MDEEENGKLNRGPYVDTIIGTGQPGAKETNDASNITVEQEIYTNSKSDPFI